MGKWIWAGIPIGLGIPWLLRVGGVPGETVAAATFAAAFAVVIGYPLGWLAGHFMARDGDVETGGFRLVAWANLLSWLVPVVGMALSAVTWQFSRHAQAKRRLYMWLSTAGGSLAAVNAGFGGATTPLQSQATSTQQAAIAPLAAERSKSRCAFAAIEAWPAEDFERLCKD